MADPERQHDAPAAAAASAPASAPTATATAAATATGTRPSVLPTTPSPAPGVGPARTSLSTSVSPMRPPYIPQFSVTTKMILDRINWEARSLSPSLATASASIAKADIKPSKYEDAKRRLMMGMNTSTSMTMKMPVPVPAPAPTPVAAPPPRSVLPSPNLLSLPLPLPPPTVAEPTTTTTTKATPKIVAKPKTGPGAGMSAIMRISSGLTASGKPIIPKPPAAIKTLSADSKVKKPKPAPARIKRTRVKGQAPGTDDESDLSDAGNRSEPPAEPSSSSAAAAAAAAQAAFSSSLQAAPHTMTKSGRQVQKPLAYNPAAMDAGTRKRVHYGKRTAEQALCKKCTRMHSPASNQMVFCDGCDEGWHQRCHDPWIADDTVRDLTRGWFCAHCVAKRERQNPPAKRQKLLLGSNTTTNNNIINNNHNNNHSPAEPRPKESWAAKPTVQKRAYLFTLTQQELVGLLMTSLELHPDLLIFPAPPEPSPNASRATPTTMTTKGRAGGSKGGSGSGSQRDPGPAKEESQDGLDDDDEEFDPLAALWPKPGMGLYSQLPPDTDDDERLVDREDYEAFSNIVYDARGRKVEENGMKV